MALRLWPAVVGEPLTCLWPSPLISGGGQTYHTDSLLRFLLILGRVHTVVFLVTPWPSTLISGGSQPLHPSSHSPITFPCCNPCRFARFEKLKLKRRRGLLDTWVHKGIQIYNQHQLLLRRRPCIANLANLTPLIIMNTLMQWNSKYYQTDCNGELLNT